MVERIGFVVAAGVYSSFLEDVGFMKPRSLHGVSLEIASVVESELLLSQFLVDLPTTYLCRSSAVPSVSSPQFHAQTRPDARPPSPGGPLCAPPATRRTFSGRPGVPVPLAQEIPTSGQVDSVFGVFGGVKHRRFPRCWVMGGWFCFVVIHSVLTDSSLGEQT